MKKSAFVITILLWTFLLPVVSPLARHPAHRKEIPAVIWRDPGAIPARDLYFGPGSSTRAPLPPFVFERETKKGRSPKIRVVDANKVKWSVKLGPEARPETVSTRIIWSVGYFAEEAYYLKRVRIENLPRRLSRGNQYIEEPGVLLGARFKPRRKEIKREEIWDWNQNPFVGTRKLDGLKVLMALLNNYDTHENNRVLILKNPREARYVVSDLGATFGRTAGFGQRRSEDNVEDFVSTRFVLGVKNGLVRFDYHTRPSGIGWLTLFYPPFYLREVGREKTFRDVPIEPVRWVGSLLSRLTNKQLYDAFRAADYDSATMEKYVSALRKRIGEISQPPFLVQTLKSPD